MMLTFTVFVSSRTFCQFSPGEVGFVPAKRVGGFCADYAILPSGDLFIVNWQYMLLQFF